KGPKLDDEGDMVKKLEDGGLRWRPWWRMKKSFEVLLVDEDGGYGFCCVDGVVMLRRKVSGSVVPMEDDGGVEVGWFGEEERWWVMVKSFEGRLETMILR
ncbi:hypothetical protein PIB30_105545, partial [Stylosanthes scabra]|nr:hypothetical protein [Stylosanthes scabra]